MMNFLALILAAYLISGPWASGTEPVSAPISPEGFLPIIVPGGRVAREFSRCLGGRGDWSRSCLTARFWAIAFA